MAFPAFLSEAYEALRRVVGADVPSAPDLPRAWRRPARVVPEAAVIEDTWFRSIDGKFDALSHTMGKRLDALSQRLDVLNQPSDRLSCELDQRFDALNHAMNQRFDALNHAMDQRSDALNHAMDQRSDALSRRFDALDHTIEHRFASVDQQFVARDAEFARLEIKTTAMDVWLKRLETKTATQFRYLRWGLTIGIALVLGLVTMPSKVILDWLMP